MYNNWIRIELRIRKIFCWNKIKSLTWNLLIIIYLNKVSVLISCIDIIIDQFLVFIEKFSLATYSQLSSLRASLNSPEKDEVFYLRPPMSVFYVVVRGLSKCIKVSEKFPVYVETLPGNEILRRRGWTLFGRRSVSAIHASYVLPWKSVNHFVSIYNEDIRDMESCV